MVVRTVPALRRAVETLRARKATTALVPTMGALHDGHVSLVRLAKRRAGKVIVSIFVNPTQFAPTEDFGSYPRTWKADVAKLTAENVDLIWHPEVKSMYPDGFATKIVPEGPAIVGRHVLIAVTGRNTASVCAKAARDRAVHAASAPASTPHWRRSPSSDPAARHPG
jgi:pantoate--beta-alanine ligase